MDPVVVVGLVLAAGFWILTQANIIWTKNALSKRVIAASAETKQQAIDTVVGMEQRLEAQVAKVEGMVAELPDPEDIEFDYEAIGQVVSKHMEMAFRQVEAQQAKRTGQFLKEMGIDDKLKDLEGAAREQAMAQMGIEGQIAMEILEMKVNKKASVVEKLVLQKAKLEAAKMIQGSMGADETIIQPASVGRGFGVR